MSFSTSRRYCGRMALVLALLATSAFLSQAWSQTTIAAGAIAGVVLDAAGAGVSGAQITVTGPSGQTITAKTDDEGDYTIPHLIPGDYKVRIAFKESKTTQILLKVRVNTTANGSAQLQKGKESEVVQVVASDPQPETEKGAVQGVITATQMESLPFNGRNFMDMAQFEPGVQTLDGAAFDPIKAGSFAVSTTGRYGRTTRVAVDGADISDETVGTTTTNVPTSAIQEFQVSQSNLDLSTGLTSSGALNVTTKSGTDVVHGQVFGTFRDSSVSSQLPTPRGLKAPFQRDQYGGNVGGPIIKDKAFLFVNGERTVQHTHVPVLVANPFAQYAGTFNGPYVEDNLGGRLDYLFKNDARAFYRFSYFENSMDTAVGYGYSLYRNLNVTRDHVLGADFSKGGISHEIRFSYLKFHNEMGDAATGNRALPFNNLGAQIVMGTSGLIAGPNIFAPRNALQSDLEGRYDGTKVWGTHSVRFGGSYNYLQGGGFAAFYRNGPQVLSRVTPGEVTAASVGPFAGGSSNPLNYPADSATLSNGQGFSTAKAALGFPAGGLGPDNRLLLYVGDTWKATQNLTLTYGLRYQRDTGRTDSQYPDIPQLNALMPGLGLGKAVMQPNRNFAPQFGFAWNFEGAGTTVVRGGIGLFWENALWNNLLLDAPYRQPTGTFLQVFSPCSAPGAPVILKTTNGDLNTSGSASATAICGAPGSTGFPLIGNALPALVALQQAYAAASPFNPRVPNPAYPARNLTDCGAGTNCFFAPGDSMLNPAYRTPRSVQMNFGVQHLFRPGAMVSIDFVRNIETHYLLGTDQNHAGDSRFFNLLGAQAAILKTLNMCGAPSVTASWSTKCPLDPANGTTDGGTWGTSVNPARPANISDYAHYGLGSSADMGGRSCLGALGYNCGFGGINPLAPPLGFLSPVGRSIYNGLQMRVVDTVQHPFPWAKTGTFQASYVISRFKDSGGAVAPDAPFTLASSEQSVATPALDNADPNRYFGPSALDRTHQISFGGVFEFPKRLQVGLVGHFDSPLAGTLAVPNTGAGAGEIFRTDFSGDGTTQDVLPGTKVGNFDRGIDATDVDTAVSKYNRNVAGQPTPAGQALVANRLMTANDLANLGGVPPTLAAPPFGEVNYSWLRTLDVNVTWNYTFKERVTIRPSVAVFNLGNFANFNLPPNMMSGLLTGSIGSINGTTPTTRFVNRVGAGTGVFTLGAPRQIEFGLKVNF